MVKIKYLGTCSGTEPMKDMHHCSLIFEVGDSIYWFDAGENCAHTAYTSGVDVLKTRALFISHAHSDHVCGLPALLALFKKLINRYKTPLAHNNTIEVFMTEPALFDAAATLCNGGATPERVPRLHFDANVHELFDGVVYEDENVRVSAIHNTHLKEDGSAGWHAYSFLIEAEGKRIVFSGDVGKPYELDGLLADGCDLLIMETGHHKVKDVCEYAISRGVGVLRFNHHGREILEDRDAAESLIAQYSAESGTPIKLCFDGMTDEM